MNLGQVVAAKIAMLRGPDSWLTHRLE